MGAHEIPTERHMRMLQSCGVTSRKPSQAVSSTPDPGVYCCQKDGPNTGAKSNELIIPAPLIAGDSSERVLATRPLFICLTE
jgi:hypothetical protein